MARVSMTGFDDLESMFSKLMEPTKMAIKAVDAAAPVLEESFRSEIRKAADRTDKKGRPYSTGELAASVHRTEAKENHLGVFSVAKVEGTDSKGVRNVEKLAYLEYGVASKGQVPHPVRQKAINAAEEECVKIMQEVIYEEVDKL